MSQVFALCEGDRNLVDLVHFAQTPYRPRLSVLSGKYTVRYKPSVSEARAQRKGMDA